MTIRLETDRLILRPLAPEDAEAHCAMMADRRVAKYLSLDGEPQPKAMAWRGFSSMLGHWEIRGFGFFSVIEKASGVWLGRVGPWAPEGWPGVECGWGIAPAYWGRGFAPEAAVAAIDWIFEERPDLERIISLIDPSNAASQAVARKVGETKTAERFTYDKFVLDVWAAGRETWLARFGRVALENLRLQSGEDRQSH